MENYIQNIELINKYLNKELSKTDIKDFENRLKTDSDFSTLYDEHNIFLEGIKRQQLKTEIVKAKQGYIKGKWIKLFGASFIVLAIVAIAYVLISNTSTEPIQNNNQEFNSTVMDTVSSRTWVKTPLKTTDSLIVKDSIIPKKGIDEIESERPTNNTEILLTKPAQKLKINTQKDTIIVCKEGTKLTIEANSFVNKNGDLIKGTIDLNVTEYYKLSDMLLANLSTTSDGEQLETGGMLHIEASKDDEVLKLKSPIEITFSNKNKKENMQIFSGEWDNETINWKLQKEKETIIEEIVVENIEEDIEVPYAVVEEVPVYPGCDKGSNVQKRRCTSAAIQEFVQRNFNTSISQGLGLRGKQRINVIFKIDKFGNATSIQSRASHPLLEQEAERVIALLPRMTPGKQRGKAVKVPYSLPIVFTAPEAIEINTSLGEVSTLELSNNQVEYDTIYTTVRGEVEQIRAVMHDKNFEVDSAFIKTWKSWKDERLIRIIGDKSSKVILRKPLFEMDNTRFKILEDDSISRGGHIIRKVWNDSLIPTTSRIMRLVPKPQIIVGNTLVTEDELNERLLDPDDNKNISTKAINTYAMRVLNLGWINLDRFIKNGNTLNYKIKVKNRNGKAKVNMVFKSVSSILSSRNIKGHFSFGNVTKDEDVILVAIKKQSGKLFLDIIDTKIEANPEIDFNFKEVSLQELKNELQKLNKLF